MWQDISLPITLPKDEGTYFVDQNASRVTQYPFEPLFRATALMSPAVRFDDVDIVVNRNSLRKLLDFCGGRVKESFRVNILLIDKSLFIERCERSARKLIRGSQNAGWGRSFERAFTKFPPGLEDSTGHHRVLRYPLGDLNCVVRFEVDASYEKMGGETAADPINQVVGSADLKSLAVSMNKLSIRGSTEDEAARYQAMETRKQARLMPQSTAAEIKAKTNPGNLGTYLPQLWFGRTPWLIIGRHANGTFNKINITNAAAQFVDWETRHQTKLRKLVSVLTQLREVARKHQGRNCIAICEKGSLPRTIKIFASTVVKQVLPDDLVREFWVSQNGQSTQCLTIR